MAAPSLPPLHEKMRRLSWKGSLAGEGTYGVVKHDETHAVKVSRGLHPPYNECIRNEIAILGLLGKHQHVVEMIANDESNRRGIMFLMPVYPANLLGLGRLELAEYGARITTGLLDAVEFVHSRGVIHCDIKPANVLISKEYDAVLCDFGAAMRSDAISFEANQEETLARLEENTTCSYLAPYPRPNEPRFPDAWAVYACVFFILTGGKALVPSAPHCGCSDSEVVKLFARLVADTVEPLDSNAASVREMYTKYITRARELFGPMSHAYEFRLELETLLPKTDVSVNRLRYSISVKGRGLRTVLPRFDLEALKLRRCRASRDAFSQPESFVDRIKTTAETLNIEKEKNALIDGACAVSLEGCSIETLRNALKPYLDA